MRNLSANDDIKTTLCRRPGVVEQVVHLMQTYPEAALLQEHACGWIAAAALRQPANAILLVQQAHVHAHIVTAMQHHPTVVPLQRQAALAIRNLVGRATPDVRRAVLDEAATEDALRNVAGRLMPCQDEVYAALRDLGLTVTSVHVQQDEDGQVKVLSRGRPMFGEGNNTNFRPVFH